MPRIGERVEYRITGGGARQINASSDLPVVTAGDWAHIVVVGERKHSTSDAQILIGTIYVNGKAYHQVEATPGEGFGCWRSPADAGA